MTESVPAACGSAAETKAAYRFFANDQVTPEKINKPHEESTLSRMREHSIILIQYQRKDTGPTTKDSTKGMHLHCALAVLLDEAGKVVYDKRLPNDINLVLREYQQFEGIDSVVVESTYNWYWLVDGLMEAGYQVKLANPNAIQQYNGIKRNLFQSMLSYFLSSFNKNKLQ